MIRKLKEVCAKWIIVEPLVFLYIMTNMNGVPVQNIYYNKFAEILNNTKLDDDVSDEVEEKTNEFIRNTTMIYAGLSACLMAVLGPVSDRFGRKFGILWTVALTGVTNALFGLLYFLDTNNIVKIDINYYYIPQICFGIGGSNYNMFFSVFSYVGDLSNLDPETRLRRFTLSEAAIGVGVIAGYYVGSLVVQFFGDFYIFVVCTCLCLVAFIYGVVRIKNIIPGMDGDDYSEKVNILFITKPFIDK